MKAKTILLALLVVLPAMGFAQNDDDMYFVPKKSKVVKPTISSSSNSSSSRIPYYNNSSEDVGYSIGPLRDVDEYNRRGTGKNVTIITETDTFQVDESQLTLNEEGQYVLSKGYSGLNEEPAYLDDDADYYYSSRLSRFHGVGYPYGWYSPWYYDSFYYDPWYYGSYWGHPYYSWYGWRGYYGWYDPWYYGWGASWYPRYPHHPHVGHHSTAGGRVVSPSRNGGLSSRGYAYGNSSRSGRSGNTILGRGISSRSSASSSRSSASSSRSSSRGIANSSSRSTINNPSRSGGSTRSSSSRSSSYGGSRSGSSSSRGGGFSSGGGFSGGSRGGGGFSGGSRGGGRR